MDTKLFARIGAGAFVAVALTMTVLELREEPRVSPTEVITVFEPDGDPLPGQLKACAAMGELALSNPDCRAAWAEKRRRFLGVEADTSPIDPAAPPAVDAIASDQPPTTKAN
ncbi:putative entry exclusion protein TrbK-alt [Novosphingobium sp.]|uniref:putative entry exclusion protein TrbK-alt n=1 Tax=Novosphingobium sp. TaxID=1874826 RepID=UPI0027328183|nr:putative entry exclusion protein TrbK-alt [Novosphingobium sp.]MDP3906761.1 putative entry exclusion protein TrbK-alt [Novosphingobium sp.]